LRPQRRKATTKPGAAMEASARSQLIGIGEGPPGQAEGARAAAGRHPPAPAGAIAESSTASSALLGTPNRPGVAATDRATAARPPRTTCRARAALIPCRAWPAARLQYCPSQRCRPSHHPARSGPGLRAAKQGSGPDLKRCRPPTPARLSQRCARRSPTRPRRGKWRFTGNGIPAGSA